LKVEVFSYKASSETTYKAGYTYDEACTIEIPSGYKILGIVGSSIYSGLLINYVYPLFYQGVRYVAYVRFVNRSDVDVKIPTNGTIFSAHVLFVKA
jgi:hypothetical protein